MYIISCFPFTVTIPTVDPIPVTSTSQDVIQLSPDDVQTELNFTCTVEAEGSFQWTWSEPGVLTDYANTNRTSFYTLTPLSADSAGTISCAATYTTESPTGSKDFTIQFQPCKLYTVHVYTYTCTHAHECTFYMYVDMYVWQKMSIISF